MFTFAQNCTTQRHHESRHCQAPRILTNHGRQISNTTGSKHATAQGRRKGRHRQRSVNHSLFSSACIENITRRLIQTITCFVRVALLLQALSASCLEELLKSRQPNSASWSHGAYVDTKRLGIKIASNKSTTNLDNVRVESVCQSACLPACLPSCLSVCLVCCRSACLLASLCFTTTMTPDIVRSHRPRTATIPQSAPGVRHQPNYYLLCALRFASPDPVSKLFRGPTKILTMQLSHRNRRTNAPQVLRPDEIA